MTTTQERRGASFARQLTVYAIGLLVAYGGALAVFWPPAGQKPSDLIFLAVMFAPTIGALAARIFAGARIQLGRPNLWILAGLIPAAAVLVVYLIGNALGWDSEDPAVLKAALMAAPVSILTASLSALGEEIGWRGFMWPLFRERWTYWRSGLTTFVIWWAYHVPLIIAGWYGELKHLPAFTVAIFGFTLFLGVITDRSRSMWPSVITHGAWNGLVATSFAASEGTSRVPGFAGSDELMGEFGWLAAITSLVVGVAAAVWHNRTHSAPTGQTSAGAGESA